MGRISRAAAGRIRGCTDVAQQRAAAEGYLLGKVKPEGTDRAQQARLRAKARALGRRLGGGGGDAVERALAHALCVAQAGRDPRFVAAVGHVERAASPQEAHAAAQGYVCSTLEIAGDPTANQGRCLAAAAALAAAVRGPVARGGVEATARLFGDDTFVAAAWAARDPGFARTVRDVGRAVSQRGAQMIAEAHLRHVVETNGTMRSNHARCRAAATALAAAVHGPVARAGVAAAAQQFDDMQFVGELQLAALRCVRDDLRREYDAVVGTGPHAVLPLAMGPGLAVSIGLNGVALRP